MLEGPCRAACKDLQEKCYAKEHGMCPGSAAGTKVSASPCSTQRGILRFDLPEHYRHDSWFLTMLFISKRILQVHFHLVHQDIVLQNCQDLGTQKTRRKLKFCLKIQAKVIHDR